MDINQYDKTRSKQEKKKLMFRKSYCMCRFGEMIQSCCVYGVAGFIWDPCVTVLSRAKVCAYKPVLSSGGGGGGGGVGGGGGGGGGEASPFNFSPQKILCMNFFFHQCTSTFQFYCYYQNSDMLKLPPTKNFLDPVIIDVPSRSKA